MKMILMAQAWTPTLRCRIPWRNAALVVDAGGIDLIHMDNQGHVELLAVSPEELVSTAKSSEPHQVF
jgi:hypothetical protein